MSSKLLGTVVLVGIIAAIPLTVLVSQQNQDTRQHASTSGGISEAMPTDFASDVVTLMNQERQNNGNLPPLRLVPQLAQAATNHNALMNQCAGQFGTSPCFQHKVTQLNEPDLLPRISSTGYPAVDVGENIAWGQRTPTEVVAAWMASTQGHREAILNNGKWPDVGCSYIAGNGTDNTRIFWTCDFGKASGAVPTITIGPTQTVPSPTSIVKTPTPTFIPLPPNWTADIDRDGCVGILDFNTWLVAFQTGVIRSGTFPDVNENGALEIFDFNLWFMAMLSLPSDKLCV